MYNNAGYMYSVWPLKKLSLMPKYSDRKLLAMTIQCNALSM